MLIQGILEVEITGEETQDVKKMGKEKKCPWCERNLSKQIINLSGGQWFA